jgi:CBS domain-containing protein
MKLSEIMTADFEMMDSTSSLTDAADRMKSLDVGVLPIKEGTKLIGVLTDRDIVVRGLAEHRDPNSTQVKDVISSEIVYCDQDESVEQAAELMEAKKVRRLVVTDQERTPVGIVSLGDLAARTERDNLAGEALEEISKPAGPRR